MNLILEEIVEIKKNESLSYRQWQKRNTENFNFLTKKQQKIVRQQGYCNRGWNNVKKSWGILGKQTSKLTSLFEYKLNQGQIVEAIDLSILEAEKAKKIAQDGIKKLQLNQKNLNISANKVLEKYPLL